MRKLYRVFLAAGALPAALMAALIGGTVLLDATPARADNAAEARKAFKAGRTAFKAGNYAVAATELGRAYKLKPHPALLRYLGQTYYKMNKARKAISYFKRYLKDSPQAPDRAKIQAKVRELEMVVGASDDDDDDSSGKAAASSSGWR